MLRLLSQLKSGDIDAVLVIGKNPEREKLYQYPALPFLHSARHRDAEGKSACGDQDPRRPVGDEARNRRGSRGRRFRQERPSHVGDERRRHRYRTSTRSSRTSASTGFSTWVSKACSTRRPRRIRQVQVPPDSRSVHRHLYRLRKDGQGDRVPEALQRRQRQERERRSGARRQIHQLAAPRAASAVESAGRCPRAPPVFGADPIFLASCPSFSGHHSISCRRDPAIR